MTQERSDRFLEPLHRSFGYPYRQIEDTIWCGLVVVQKNGYVVPTKLIQQLRLTSDQKD